MIAIPNMDKPKDCDGIGINIHFTDGHMELHILDECELIEIDLVRCKDCKHYDTSRSFPCCTDIFGAVRYMEPDGFCSKGERRADEHKR